MRGRGRSLVADESPQPNPDQQQQPNPDHHHQQQPPNPDQQQVALEPRVEGEKIIVEPNVMGTKLLDSGKVSRRLLKIFRSRWFVEGSAWKKLTGEHRKFYFDEFKKYFRWEACYTDDNIMDVFFKHAARSYADTISKMRTSGKKDPSVDEAVWAVWVQEWATDDAKQKSDTARSNRLSEPSGPGTGPSRHTGGSRSAILHQKALATVLGREPTLVEMLVHTHTKKSDRTVFVDERARQAHDRYNELVAAASQTVEGAAESSQIDENKLYLEAVDGIKKQRIYGVGSCASSYIAASSPSTAGTQQRGYKSQLREEIRNELREEIRNTHHQHFLQKQSLGVSADEKIHNVPLGESNVRVAVEYVIAPNALLPVPVVGEMTMVKDAIGSFVAWPKEFVLSGAEEVENQAAGEESGPIQAFASFVDQMVQTDSIIIPVQSAIFEAEFEAHLHKDHLFSLCNMQELTDSCIITYIRYLYVNLTSTQGRYAFVNPSSMNSARGTPASSVVTKRLQLAEKDQLVFVPYKTKGHWVLIIIDSSSMDVYWLDPLQKPLPMDIKIHLTMGLKALQTDGKKRPHPVWHCVKCPKQSLDVQCGYHVMRYMKELLEESTQPLAEKILQLGQKETYTQDETDEVRLEFIDFVLAHI